MLHESYRYAERILGILGILPKKICGKQVSLSCKVLKMLTIYEHWQQFQAIPPNSFRRWIARGHLAC